MLVIKCRSIGCSGGLLSCAMIFNISPALLSTNNAVNASSRQREYWRFINTAYKKYISDNKESIFKILRRDKACLVPTIDLMFMQILL
jgi:hypothetical protein